MELEMNVNITKTLIMNVNTQSTQSDTWDDFLSKFDTYNDMLNFNTYNDMLNN